MYKRVVIFPYKPASEGAKALKVLLNNRGIKALFPTMGDNSKYRYKDTDLVINWGNSNKIEHKGLPDGVPIINPCVPVSYACNKLAFFSLEGSARVPPWTTIMDTVKTWLEEGSTVCARQKINGTGGEGLVLFNAFSEEVPKAPLYTKYIKKKDEYRIHVFRGNVIDMQRKAIRPGHENPNFQVRNLEGGFIYVRNDVEPPIDVIKQAVAALVDANLDFGAVDVIYNAKSDQAYVLEVNTAPGLQGATVVSYVEAIKGLMT